MTTDPLTQLRHEARKQLLNYRTNAARTRMRRPRKGGENDALWVLAITGAMKAVPPLKAKVIGRLFGLEKPIPRYQPVRERVIKLSIEYNVSESTVYSWREDVVHRVMLAAVEIGIARPFGIAPSAEKGNLPAGNMPTGNMPAGSATIDRGQGA